MNWHGYCIISIDKTVPQQHLSIASSIVHLAGVSPTTKKPHEKSVLVKCLDGTKYIWELTMKNTNPPSLNYLRNGIANNSPLTIANVEAMIKGLLVVGEVEETKQYINDNKDDWKTTPEELA